MPTFSSGMDRSIEAKFEDGELVWVKLWERGSLLDEYIPSENENIERGRVLYHHPQKGMGTKKTGGGFLWLVREILDSERKAGDTLLTNLRSNDREDYDFEYLKRGMREGFITPVETK